MATSSREVKTVETVTVHLTLTDSEANIIKALVESVESGSECIRHDLSEINHALINAQVYSEKTYVSGNVRKIVRLK